MSQKTSFPWWLKPANHLIILLNRLGVSIGTMHILSIPGCKTSKMRSTPVSILLVNGQQYILADMETGWVKNARSASWGLLSYGRKTERVALVELPVEKRPLILFRKQREYSTGSLGSYMLPDRGCGGVIH
ncbi:hypothetical protein [Ktedonobacter sp. SOSP1-52]|uniref:hypothetical protein n=1 Tax=Ktedonobacter sp. SOSP1-52 TaxID=2778366 RepID=UPI0019164BD5|nr:hypothetical protein [Ktedonobacter sp. SOSP1-52]